MSAPPIYQPGAPAPSVMRQQRDATAYGAGMARGLDELGGAGVQLVDTEHRLKVGQEVADYGARAAQARANIEKLKMDLQADPSVTPDGYVEKVRSAVDSTGQQLSEGLTTQQAQMHAKDLWSSFSAGTEAEAHGWSVKARVDQGFANLQQQVTTSGAIANRSDPGIWDEEVHAADTTINGQLGSAEQIEQARAASGREIYAAGFDGLTDRDPQRAIALLDSGKYDSWLDGKAQDLYRTRAQAKIAHDAAQGKAAAGQAYEAAVGELDLTAQQYQQGTPSFDQASALAARYAQAAAVAPTVEKANAAREKAQAWGFRGVGAAAVTAHQGDTVQQLDAAANALAALPTRTAEQGAALDALKQRRAYLATLSTVDQIEARTGKALTAAAIENPASIVARTAEVDAAGGGDILKPIEAAPLTKIATHGSLDQKVELGQRLAQLGATGGRIARQIVPNDGGGFAAVLSLAPIDPDGELQRLALSGPDALKANPKLLEPEKLPTGKQGPDHKRIFTDNTAVALAKMPAEFRAAVAYNATNIYATLAGRQGATQFDGGLFNHAINMALGARYNGTHQTGGIGLSNGRRFVLPRGWAMGQWNETLARATLDKWAAAAGGRITAHGTKDVVAPAQLSALPAVAIGGGRYALATGENTFLTKGDGARFEFDPRKLK